MENSKIGSNARPIMTFSKVRDVKSPSYGTPGSAGIDFYVPNDFGPVVVNPNTDLLIPSGIKVNIPKGFMLLGADKSGVVISKNAQQRAGLTPKADTYLSPVIIGAKVIDEDYQGELHIHIINCGNAPIILRPGRKIAQFILVPVGYVELIEMPEAKLFTEKTERGAGMASSTGQY